MNYKIQLTFLRFLVYVKRFFWWLGGGLFLVMGKIVGRFMRAVIFVRYKIYYSLKRLGFGTQGGFFLKRDVLQIALFLILFYIASTQTTLFSKRDLSFSLQGTAVFAMINTDSESNLEEVFSVNSPDGGTAASWRQGALSSDNSSVTGQPASRDIVLSTPVAGGGAFFKPSIVTGASLPQGVFTQDRTEETPYTVEPGDSLSTIAYQFGVSVATIMWNNNLSLKSLIRPGDELKVPPVSGMMHTVRKGDTIKKIAALYDAKQEDIIAFNKIKDGGASLKQGQRLVVPGGVKPQERALATTVRTSPSYNSFANKVATPPASRAISSGAGFIWPSGSHMITQYFNAGHHAIDIAGPWQTPTYAAKAGVVEKAQCGWNGGYGCYVIIDHGNGIKTLYGHHSVLLVKSGETVEQGQVIALMGNTGNVRGVTGIHLHFEVIANNIRVNPLGYVH